jgi:hypothetical protein
VIFVQANLRRQAPLSRLPNTHRSRLEGTNLPKYLLAIQRFPLWGWVHFAHL